MANIIRTSKSGCDWTASDLAAFNINIFSQNSADFFGVSPLPEPNIPAAILTTPTAADARTAHDAATLNFLAFLQMAMTGIEEGAVDNFAVAVFRLMGYERFNCLVRFKRTLTFIMCGEERRAQTGVCIVSDGDILLVVQEDKRDDRQLPEAQLVAEAIAAFTHNNERLKIMGQAPLSAWIIPGIIMRGTFPIFYKIPVTQNLINCVRDGLFPAEPTNILQHAPVLPDGPEVGMFTLRSRQVVLRCYEAFKTIVFQQPK